MRIWTRALLVAVGVLALASCEDGGTGLGAADPGEFRVTVSGDVDGDFSGTARIYQDDFFLPESQSHPGRLIILTSSDGAEIMLRPGGILTGDSEFDFQEGRHRLGVLTDVQADLVTGTSTTVGVLYIATEGTLRVTRSSEERVAGEFEFDAVFVETDRSTRRVRVRGAFHALQGPTFGAARQAPR